MRGVRPLAQACCLLLLTQAPLVAQSTTAKARLDSAVMELGDPNRLVVTIDGLGAGVRPRVDFSALDTVRSFSVSGEQTETREGERLLVGLPFSVYDSVGLLLPALPVYLADDTVYTNDLALLVTFPKRDSAGLNPIRGIVTEPARLSDYLGWIIGAGAVLLLGLGAWAFGRRKRTPPPAAPVYVEPADTRALRELAELRQREIADDPFYTRLDQVLRRYLEDRYGIPALERTSSEVVALLRTRGLPDSNELDTLLQQVDLVKFAKAELPRERRGVDVNRVEAFVRATAPREEPRAESPEAGGGAVIIENGVRDERR